MPRMTLNDWLSAHQVRPMQFAQTVGVTHVTVYRLLNGKRRPSWDLAKRIESATGGAVRPEDLFERRSAAEAA